MDESNCYYDLSLYFLVLVYEDNSSSLQLTFPFMLMEDLSFSIDNIVLVFYCLNLSCFEELS